VRKTAGKISPLAPIIARIEYNAQMQLTILKNLNRKALLTDFLNALLVALFFSTFIYLAHWELTVDALNTLFGLFALYALLVVNRRTVLISGFFIGLLWFYWIGYSFQYYGMGWMAPLVSLLFALIYLLFFGVLALGPDVWVRALLLLGLSVVEPMDFNWMQPELLFVDSYFGVEKWQFALILAGLALFAGTKSPWRFASLLLFAAALNYGGAEKKPLPPLDVKLVATELPQAEKWEAKNLSRILGENFAAIDDAISEGYDLVILPESAFPLYLNHYPLLEQRLSARSERIAIITGALYEEEGRHYNVSYFFKGGKVQVAKKMVLVPFGEYIPLPGFLKKWVNDLFFSGASDFVTAEKPTDFDLDGVTFRNAVCYEATCEELYEGEPAYMAALSNNGWFYPSIEPTLQRLLMKYYARRHGTVIFHSANMGGSGIVE
jgi:apolipoprotein N-acyltransferase